MPLLCAAADIKYTVVMLNDDELKQSMESAEEHGIHDSIYGFISDGNLWIDGVEWIDDHWTDEIIAAHPETYMLVMKGSPGGVDSLLEQYLTMERDWYHQHDLYDLWQTSVGHVAVC